MKNTKEISKYKTDFYFHEDNWLYVRIPKNASSTIMAAFNIARNSKNLYEIDLDKINKIFMVTRNPFDRLVSCWQDRLARHHQLEPVDIIGKNFPAFIKMISKIPDDEADHHFRSQYYFIKNINKKIDFFDIESLEKKWNIIGEIIGRKGKTKPGKWRKVFGVFPVYRRRAPLHLKKSRMWSRNFKSDYKQYYTPDLIDLVNIRYKEDLELFNYKFKE